MKIVLDMNLPPSWVEFLSQHGIQAVHWANVGETRAFDVEIMKWAVENKHVVFTHDLDFTTLLAVTGANGPSVIQMRSQDVLPDAVGSQVISVLSAHKAAIQNGAIVTVDMVTSRVRLLPIRRGPEGGG